MIKLPNAIVIYPQRLSVPSYLLCWIPAREYPALVGNPEKRAELEKLYPRGIEIELSENGLQEAGINLPATPEELRRAYLALFDAHAIKEDGVVDLTALRDFLHDEEGSSVEAVTADLAEQMTRIDHLGEGELLRKIRTEPPMTDGEEAMQVIRRLDVQKSTIDLEEGGN